MTLDEQIAWLADEACLSLRFVREANENDDWYEYGDEAREHAATLLTIENTLREVQRTLKPRIRNGDPIVVLMRPARRPRKNEQPELVRATYIKRDREQGGVLVDIDGKIRRVRHANIRRAA